MTASSILPIPPVGTPIDSEPYRRYLLSIDQAISNNLAPNNAQYWVSTPDPVLSNERNLGGLASGYLKITTAIGIAAPSTVTGIPTSDLTGTVSVTHGGTGSDLSSTGGTAQVLRQSSMGASITVGALSFSDVSGLVSLSQGGTGANLSATGGTSRVLRQSSVGAAVTVSQLTTTDISGAFMAIGGTVTSATDGSLLFVHPAGILAQGSLSWEEATLTLTVGTVPFLDFGNSTWGIGVNVLEGADPVSDVIALGTSTATRIQAGASGMVAIGGSAGYEAFQAGNALLIGALTGFKAENASNLLALGNGAARGATNAASAIMGGGECGRGATTAARVLWWGTRAGYLDTINIDPDSEDFSILYGGYSSSGGFKNAIGVGQGVQNSAEQQFNIGNVLFGLNIYTGTTPDPTPVANPLVGIGTAAPVTRLDLQDGAITIKKMGSDPATPATDCAVLWGRDDGFGKFAYMIKFDDASEVQIAVQP